MPNAHIDHGENVIIYSGSSSSWADCCEFQKGMASRDYLLATIKGDAALPAFAELLFLDQM